jgi:hypothetical protein
VSAGGRDIEALLTGAAGRVRTLRAELREWADPEALRRALDRVMPGAGENVPGGEPVEHESRHWYAAPDRVREERAGAVTIRRGDTWWVEDTQLGALTNEGDPGQTTTGGELIRSWIAPARILPHVELTVVDTDTAAGRRALRVRAVPREGPGGIVDLGFLGNYADEWELQVDAERGVLLATAALSGGERFQSVQALEIAFDEDIEDERFAAPG